MTLELANRPYWQGRPGFFEIWFLVVFVPDEQRALWLRYTLFAPAPGQPGTPRATIWAASFDANATERAFAIKSIHPIDAYVARNDESSRIRIGDAEFGGGVCRGNVIDGGRSIAWDLKFDPTTAPDKRSSLLMSHHLPLPTRVVHAYEGTKFRGTFTVDGRTVNVDGVPGLQKHIWGHRRVEELFWLYCPAFHEDPTARIEVTSVKASRNLVGNLPFPSLTPIWFENDTGSYHFFAVWHLFRNVLRLVGPGKLHVRANSLLRAIEVDADCEPQTLVGYVYRDPNGTDLYVAQSDISSCEVRLYERSHPFASFRQTRTLTSTHGAAIEFHLPEKLEGVRYIGWDETSLPE